MLEGGFPQLQQQIANLNAAQRVSIVAAVALSSFAVYATKKHKVICGGPVDSPRHQDNCPLNFLTCAPSNDINESIANIQDTIATASGSLNDSLHTVANSANSAMADFDMDPASWNLPSLPTVNIPGLPQLRRRLEPLLGCPHDEALANHPHSQICLQCNDPRCSNSLERAYMDWSSHYPASAAAAAEEDGASTSTSPPLLRCPHNQKISPHATACLHCAERSYTSVLERGRMSNWTASPVSPGAGDHNAGSTSSSSSMGSFKSMLSPKLANLASEAKQLPLLGDAQSMLDAATTCSPPAHDDDKQRREGPVAGRASPTPVGTTALHFFLWYLCTLCNDQ